MGYEKYKKHTFVYEYDFALDGGAIGSINLRRVQGVNELEAGLVIESFTVSIETTLAGAATPTVTLGNAGAVDGYMADIFALGTAGAIVRSGEVAGSLLWDDTNDHEISYKIDSSANAVPKITIGAQALTAGKLKVAITCGKY